MAKLFKTPDPEVVTLTPTTRNIALTLSTGAGSIPINVNTSRIGIYPAASAAGRVRLGAAPEAAGAKTGTAADADLKLGALLPDQVWTWFSVQIPVDTTLYFAGAASGVFTIVLIQ